MDELTNLFNSTCSSILDTLAPPKTTCTKSLHQLWLNENTCALKLQVSLKILQNCLSKYQKSMKAAKSAFLSGLILTNCHKPHSLCEIFLRYFIDKITTSRAQLLSVLSHQVPVLNALLSFSRLSLYLFRM